MKYQQLNTLVASINAVIGNSESKTQKKLVKIYEKVKSHHERYQAQVEELRLDNASTDDKDILLLDEKGGYKFTKESIKKLESNLILFYTKLKSDEYKEKAYYEFALCKQLNVDSYPQVLIQLHSNKFYLITKSFSTYEEVKKGIEKALTEIKAGLN